MNTNRPSFATRAVHAGERGDYSEFTPVSAPIFPAVGYTYPQAADLDAVLAGDKEGFVYSSRYANPTTAAFETAVAELEDGAAAHAFASGMAALHMSFLAAGVQNGAHIVAAADIYGATYTLLQEVFAQLGAKVHFVDVTDLEQVAAAVEAHRPAAVLAETISNPLMKVADIRALADIAHAHDSLLLVDNTFASPYLCRPLAFGADVVIHSATKFIAGHGDVMAGVVVCSAEMKQRLTQLNKLIGSSAGPFEAWLALRGLKTLPLRMRQQSANALMLAQWLREQPQVSAVNYAFLPDHPQYELLHTLTNGRGAGGVLSFEIADADRAAVFRFMDALDLIQPATTLGDVYSLMLYPAMSSHRTLTAEERAAVGISEGLVRISAGIEELADIQADLERGLAAV